MRRHTTENFKKIIVYDDVCRHCRLKQFDRSVHGSADAFARHERLCTYNKKSPYYSLAASSSTPPLSTSTTAADTSSSTDALSTSTTAADTSSSTDDALGTDDATKFIKGLVYTYPGLQYLDGFPDIKVVFRADVSSATYDKVAVISGGGSGHEPAHAGFVGEGMLTAAICGDIFASPPVDSILSGIRAVTGSKGCLLIVKNYTGDRLNFGCAAEQAKSEGYEVEMVIVGDDCALPPPRGMTGRRGLAGTIFVHKVAGAAAAAGLSLAEVAAEAKRASEMVWTMSVALTACSLPGQLSIERIGPGKMELGIGIHGERGAVADLQPVDIVVSHVMKQILSGETTYVPITCGSSVVLMVNGLGRTTLTELMIAAGNAVSRLQLDHGLAVERVYTGSFMTSLDMKGFSISLMKADQTILKFLDAPTNAPNWPVGAGGYRPSVKIPIPITQSCAKKNDELPCRPKQLSPEGRTLELAIEAAASVLIKLKDRLDKWDSKVGDGDCGSTMSKGASAVLEDLKKFYPLNDPAETVNEIGSSIRKIMGGTSGLIYGIFTKAAYLQLKATGHSGITALQWTGALEAALAAVMKYGGVEEGYRTVLDALVPAFSVLKEKLAAGVDPVEAFALSAEAAIAGAESTKKMEMQAGRSRSVSSDILASVADPGAKAAASWYKAAALAVKIESAKHRKIKK